MPTTRDPPEPEEMGCQMQKIPNRHIAAYCSDNGLKLTDTDLLKATTLFRECEHRWSLDKNLSIKEIAEGLGFNNEDQHICDMVLNIWTEIYFKW